MHTEVSEHCQTVQESLSGSRAIDEKTFESIAVLSERLKYVRKLGSTFADISFSPYVGRVIKQQQKMAVS